MGLNNRSPLDPRWVFHNRRISSGFQICSINIYDEQLSERIYNATTNSYDSNSVVIWSGFARVQPTKVSSERTVKTDATFVRQVKMQIDFDGTTIADIRPGNYVLVTNSPLDQTLKNFVYIVRTVGDSSNPFQRTITCEVDLEADPNA